MPNEDARAERRQRRAERRAQFQSVREETQQSDPVPVKDDANQIEMEQLPVLPRNEESVIETMRLGADSTSSPDAVPGSVRRTDESPPADVLSNRIANPFSGYRMLVLGILGLATIIRLLALDRYLLSAREGSWAYDAWSIFDGRPLPSSQQLPTVAPVFQLANAISFFLFGATDATARVAAVGFGVGIVGLMFALRPFLSRSHVIALAILATISPTLVFASRTVEPGIAVAFFSLLTVVSLLRIGNADDDVSAGGWAIALGVGIGGTFASGVDGVTALIAIGVAVVITAFVERGQAGAYQPVVSDGVARLGRSSRLLTAVGVSLAVTVVVTFTRFLADFSAVSGIGNTFVDWGRMMASRATSLPLTFFFWAILLYELLLVVFGVIAWMMPSWKGTDAVSTRQRIHPVLPTVWLFVAFILTSWGSGREAEQTTLVVLPLTLLAGLGLGSVLARLDAADLWDRRSASFWVAAAVPITIGLAVLARVIGASGTASDDAFWAGPVVIVLMLAAVGALVLRGVTANISRGGRSTVTALMAAIVAIPLLLWTAHSMAGLAWQHADEGTELLAQDVPQQKSRVVVDQINQLSRDISVMKRNPNDPTGRFGLRMAVSPDAQWPFVWYFRNYPSVDVVGPAGWDNNYDVIVGTATEAVEVKGITAHSVDWVVREPLSFGDLRTGDVVGSLSEPESAWNYLVHRKVSSEQDPLRLSIGYSDSVNNKINPNFGPYDLFSGKSPGPGVGQGQLRFPYGIALAPDGSTIYVGNAGNQRIDRYDANGTFIGVWNIATDPRLQLSWWNNQGASGMVTDAKGNLYVADTWNHQVVVVDGSGKIVRELGSRGEVADNGDSADVKQNPGLFYGPRGIALTTSRIFVTDTGNERVQIFEMDGTFVGAFGGTGSADGQLKEPTGIVIGPDGNVWVADSGNGRISVFGQDGSFVRNIAVPNWKGQIGAYGLNALAFDTTGTLYVTSPVSRSVDAYNGSEWITLQGNPVQQPAGLTVMPNGTLLVVDTAAAQVLRITPSLPSGFAKPMASPTASPIATPVATPRP